MTAMQQLHHKMHSHLYLTQAVSSWLGNFGFMYTLLAMKEIKKYIYYQNTLQFTNDTFMQNDWYCELQYL